MRTMDCDSEACNLSPPQRYESNQFGGGGVGISPVDYAYTVPLVVSKPRTATKKISPPRIKKQIGRGKRKQATPVKKSSAKKTKKPDINIKKKPVVRGKPKKKGCGIQSFKLYK